ncbi:MAG: phosphodiester glycosidase family protein [Pyrinomonadaceae bacterium]
MIHLLQKTSIRFLLTAVVFATVSSLSGSSSPQAVATSPAQSQEFQEVAPGIEHLQLKRGGTSSGESKGPWLINLLRVDLSKVDIRVVHALDEGVGLETVSSMAARYKATAATNGGYFRTTGTFRGDSIGTLMLNGKLISEPNNARASVGFIKQRDTLQLVFGHLKFLADISLRGRRHGVDGVNRPPAANEVIIFTPEFHSTTLTIPQGAEAIVRNGRVTRVRDAHGSSEIPADGYVISAVGNGRDWLTRNLRRGTPVALSWRLIALDVKQEALWRNAQTILGGGPQLIRGGEVSITNEQEKILPSFVTDLHPRTAIARLASGKALLVTVDGRQPGVSVGISLNELAKLLLEFGAVEAINLDGGGSTAMVVLGKLVNRPSDQSGERPVSDAVLVLTRAN